MKRVNVVLGLLMLMLPTMAYAENIVFQIAATVIGSFVVISLIVFVVLREVILWCLTINHMLAELKTANANLEEIIKRMPPPPPSTPAENQK